MKRDANLPDKLVALWEKITRSDRVNTESGPVYKARLKVSEVYILDSAATRIEQLEKALKPFVEYAGDRLFTYAEDDIVISTPDVIITNADFIRARALSPDKEP